MKPSTHPRQSQSPEYPLPRKGPFNPFSDLSGIRPASEDASLLPSTAASFLYQPSKSESTADRWGEEEVCVCKDCRVSRFDLSLPEVQRKDSRRDLEFQDGEREHPPSFRASPKFQDVPNEMTQDSLAVFLTEAGLQSLVPVLQEHEVTLGDLFLLTREDLADMKIPIGPRNRLLNLLQKGPNGSLNLSKVEPQQSDPELDSPKQHSAPSVKPATPEKHPQRAVLSPPANDPAFQQQRRILNEEVENFMQELDELLTRSQRRKQGNEMRETKLAEAQSVEARTMDMRPAERPMETRPLEMKHIETKPVETRSMETRPMETRPLETKHTESAAQLPVAVPPEHMEMLKSLLSQRERLVTEMESAKRTISEIKENRSSRDASPVPKADSFKGASISPKTKVPLNMKRGLINRLK